MELSDELAADRQPQAAPLDHGCSSRDKRKNGSKTRSRASAGCRPRVGDDHRPGIGVGLPDHAHPPARWRVLHGVGDEIAEDLLAARGVGDHHDLGRLSAGFPLELVPRRDRGKLAVDLGDQGADRE